MIMNIIAVSAVQKLSTEKNAEIEEAVSYAQEMEIR